MLKYISANKDEFSTIKALAEYIAGSRKKKLINTFGKFFTDNIKAMKSKCWFCSQVIVYSLDFQVSNILHNLKGLDRPPDTHRASLLAYH